MNDVICTVREQIHINCNDKDYFNIKELINE